MNLQYRNILLDKINSRDYSIQKEWGFQLSDGSIILLTQKMKTNHEIICLLVARNIGRFQ